MIKCYKCVCVGVKTGNKHSFWGLINLITGQGSRKECILENYFLFFSSKTYVVGTQKNCLNETVLLSTQNTCLIKLMGKKRITILRS